MWVYPYKVLQHKKRKSQCRTPSQENHPDRHEHDEPCMTSRGQSWCRTFWFAALTIPKRGRQEPRRSARQPPFSLSLRAVRERVVGGMDSCHRVGARQEGEREPREGKRGNSTEAMKNDCAPALEKPTPR